MEGFLIPEEGKDLRHSYPFLADIEEFKRLSADELLFARSYGLRDSGIYDLVHDEKVVRACKIAYPGNTIRLEQYQGRIPDPVMAACRRMEMFSQEIRGRAYRIVMSTMESYERLLKDTQTLIFPSEKEGAPLINVDQAKKYIALAGDIMKNIPDVVAMLEGGLGFKSKVEEQASQKTDMFTSMLMARSE